LLQIWLYASREDGAFAKRYDEICEILNLHRYRQRSRIKEQFGPSLDELKAQGYLAEWSIEATSDRKAFKIVLRHGEKFHRDRRQRLGEASPTEETESAPVAASAADDGKEGSVSPALLEALTRRGVAEQHARQVLARVTSDQQVYDQLEWADQIVAQGGGSIANPPGFYVSVIRDNITPPAGFETSSRRRLREEADRVRDEVQMEEARLGLAYEDYLQREIAQHIASLEPADYEARLALKVEVLAVKHATFTSWGADGMRQIAKTALTKDLHNEISYRLLGFNTFCRVQKLVAEPLGPPRQAQQANVT